MNKLSRSLLSGASVFALSITGQAKRRGLVASASLGALAMAGAWPQPASAVVSSCPAASTIGTTATTVTVTGTCDHIHITGNVSGDVINSATVDGDVLVQQTGMEFPFGTHTGFLGILNTGSVSGTVTNNGNVSVANTTGIGSSDVIIGIGNADGFIGGGVVNNGFVGVVATDAGPNFDFANAIGVAQEHRH